ncbi:unnamed protein product [Mesocestoides corti]|uniref:Dynein light chain n=1 Tax=Mesocestoides corti TaxID=53468 RepID=A0A0R3UA11_MESCO|nr:unnamed protein product [Mesocestoides corti]
MNRRNFNVQTDMNEDKRVEMEQLVLEAANYSRDKNPEALASNVKRLCDERFGGNWHCHVGPSFGSSFPYEINTYFYAEWEGLNILLYKYL